MHDIPSHFSLNTSKTHEKHAKTHVTYWNARYSITFQSKDQENPLGISSFAGTCNTFPRVRTRALNKQTNKRTNKRTNKQTNKQTNKRTKREIEKRRRTWQARPFAPPLSSTIAELWMLIIVNSSKTKISSLVRRLFPRMGQAQQKAEQVDNRRQRWDLMQKMPL